MARTSKNPIAWHKECWENCELFLKGKKDELARIEDMVKRLERQQSFYLSQINEAIKQGKDSFDHERFMVKRSPK